MHNKLCVLRFGDQALAFLPKTWKHDVIHISQTGLYTHGTGQARARLVAGTGSPGDIASPPTANLTYIVM